MLKIEKFNTKDFATLISWVDSEESLMQFAGPLFRFPLSTHQLDQYIAEKNRFPFKVIDPTTNTTIGHAEIVQINPTTCILCRILIGDKNLRGRGLGQELIQQLLNKAFNGPGILKVELNVYDWNTSAIKCYEKVGFTINPDRMREQEINGKIWTALNMTINRQEWLEKLAKAIN
jgi:RimJ/RimL family protein N-acetyltransferase